MTNTLPASPSVLAPGTGPNLLPALFHAMPEGGRRFWEFFTVNIRNTHTRRAYFKRSAEPFHKRSFVAWAVQPNQDDEAILRILSLCRSEPGS